MRTRLSMHSITKMQMLCILALLHYKDRSIVHLLHYLNMCMSNAYAGAHPHLMRLDLLLLACRKDSHEEYKGHYNAVQMHAAC